MEKVKKELITLGHQAPKGYRINRGFMSIEIEDLHYCSSHDFWFSPDEQKRLLHLGQPCFYTDGYLEGRHNFYGNGSLGWWRRKGITLKKALRLLKKTRNIPKGTLVKIVHNWYYTTKKKTHINLSYNYKVTKENKFDPDYQITRPGYFKNFKTDQKAKELTDLLRANGFIVTVNNGNPNFISSMIASAASYKGSTLEVEEEEGETALAYGHGLRVGFSSNESSLFGYSSGTDNVLYDKWDEFNKWSQCNAVSKNKTNEEILQTLLTHSKKNDE